jgi:Winged helix domain, variant/ATPase family associated with various cellular activities (AAA)
VSSDPSLEHLRGRLTVLERRVRAAVALRRANDQNPDDRFRGLYLAESDVDRLLGARDGRVATPDEDALAFAAEVEARADAAEAAGHALRLRHMARAFSLVPADLDLLLVALAPDLDARLEALYGYLHDDVSRRRASIGLALELAGVPLPGAAPRARLLAGAPLIDAGLLEIEEGERPFLTRGLRAPDRVTMYLLGDDRPDALLQPVLGEAGPAAGGDPAALARALGQGSRLAYLREAREGSAAGLAVAALAELSAPSVVLDLRRVAPDADLAALASCAGREARLRGAGLVAGPLDVLVARGAPAVRAFAELGWPTVLHGTCSWNPTHSRSVPVLMDVGLATHDERAAWWRASLEDGEAAGADVTAETAQFHLAPKQIARAALSARQQAALRGEPVTPDDLRAGARAQNAAELERCARRISPVVGFDDLILPGEQVAQLRELAARARHRERVLDEWGLGKGSSKGRGITGLFAGDSGTGKTMSAEVVAHDLGLDLYVIDLSTVVDKYIGETEKNLDRVFSDAEGLNAVLLFDEADALFGKRSEVSDARDRYANVEVAYLLQRMELFDGIAILTTNMRANVDEAFTRRLDVVVDFPRPEEADRLRLWQVNLPAQVPRVGDHDLEFLAHAFDLSGGNIRNVCVCAAFLAADAGRFLSMGDLIRGVAIEYRKLGRMCTFSEFGPYLELAQPEALRRTPIGA